MDRFLGERGVDFLAADPALLSTYVLGLDLPGRIKFFADLRGKIHDRQSVPEKKLVLPDEITAANLTNLTPEAYKFNPLPLGNLDLDGKTLFFSRAYQAQGDSQTLDYFIEEQLPVVNLRGQARIIQHQVGVISWLLEPGKQPFTKHRDIADRPRRGKGLGEALLRLSEDALQRLGFESLTATTSKPATISWFFHQGYNPESDPDLTPEVLQAIVKRETDYKKYLKARSDVHLTKKLKSLK